MKNWLKKNVQISHQKAEMCLSKLEKVHWIKTHNQWDNLSKPN